MKFIKKTILVVALLAFILFFGGILYDNAVNDYEAMRLETLKTDYATWPTEADGSLVQYPTEPSID